MSSEKNLRKKIKIRVKEVRDSGYGKGIWFETRIKERIRVRVRGKG